MNTQSAFQKSNINENFVELSTSMFNKPQEESEDFKPKHLKPICEDEESDGDDKEKPNTAEINQKREQNDKAMEDMVDNTNTPAEENSFENMSETERQAQLKALEKFSKKKELNLTNDPDKNKDLAETKNEDNYEEKDDLEERPVTHDDIFTDAPECGEGEKEVHPFNDRHMDANEEVEEIFSGDNNNVYEHGLVVLRLSVYNFYNKKIKLSIQINSECDAPNFHVPLCSIKCEVYQNKTKTISYFYKIHPTKPFGKYSFTYTTDIEEMVEEAPAENLGEQNAQSGVTVNEEVKVWVTEDNDMSNEQQEINCPACTMFNPIANTKCSVCGTPLPK